MKTLKAVRTVIIASRRYVHREITPEEFRQVISDARVSIGRTPLEGCK